MTARAPPTRAELLRARRLLARVEHGTALLRRKREALVRALVPLARPAALARQAIADAADAAYQAELDALAVDGAGATDATGWPPRALEVDVDVRRVWGVAVPALGPLPVWDRGLAARATAPGPTGPALFEAANRFEALAARLCDALARELHVRALGAAVARTSRQLHTLEQRVAPELSARADGITRALDERDREDQARLRALRDRRDGAQGVRGRRRA